MSSDFLSDEVIVAEILSAMEQSAMDIVESLYKKGKMCGRCEICAKRCGIVSAIFGDVLLDALQAMAENETTMCSSPDN